MDSRINKKKKSTYISLFSIKKQKGSSSFKESQGSKRSSNLSKKSKSLKITNSKTKFRSKSRKKRYSKAKRMANKKKELKARLLKKVLARRMQGVLRTRKRLNITKFFDLKKVLNNIMNIILTRISEESTKAKINQIKKDIKILNKKDIITKKLSKKIENLAKKLHSYQKIKKKFVTLGLTKKDEELKSLRKIVIFGKKERENLAKYLNRINNNAWIKNTKNISYEIKNDFEILYKKVNKQYNNHFKLLSNFLFYIKKKDKKLEKKIYII